MQVFNKKHLFYNKKYYICVCGKKTQFFNTIKNQSK